MKRTISFAVAGFMRLTATALVVTGLVAARSTSMGAALEQTIYVDCAAWPGGDGSTKAPLHSITAAMAVARGLADLRRVVIDVAEGACDDETLPILLDVPVWVRGARSPVVDDENWPDGEQDRDTLVTASNPSPATKFFVIAAPDVKISHLSIDGTFPLGPDTPGAPPPAPLGVSAVGVGGFVLSHLRIVGMGEAVRSEDSSGRISNNYLSAGRGLFVSGGAAATPAQVIVTNNRVVYRVNGIAVAGAGAFGTTLRATLTDNDVVTSFTNTGPTTPAALRVSPMVEAAANTPATLDLVVEGNHFGGSAKYGIMIHAGQLTRRSDGGWYTGQLEGRFAQNTIDGGVVNPSLVTFTNARATVLPCELDPDNVKGLNCPLLQGPALGPWIYWEYLTQARFVLSHTGELDGGLIDHPEFQPIDGYPLDNVLVVNDEVIGHQTFVVVP